MNHERQIKILRDNPEGMLLFFHDKAFLMGEIEDDALLEEIDEYGNPVTGTEKPIGEAIKEAGSMTTSISFDVVFSDGETVVISSCVAFPNKLGNTVCTRPLDGVHVEGYTTDLIGQVVYSL